MARFGTDEEQANAVDITRRFAETAQAKAEILMEHGRDSIEFQVAAKAHEAVRVEWEKIRGDADRKMWDKHYRLVEARRNSKF